jgi:hypothetical protein
MNQSGVRITGDTKDILKVGERWVVARNNAPLLLIKPKQQVVADKPLIVNR